MFLLIEYIKKFLLEFKQPRMQEGGKSFYASEVAADARDLYWRLTGEPETNPTDLVGATKMFLGKAIEEGIVNQILTNLHFFGLHAYVGEEQIRATLTAHGVHISGKLDCLLVERRGGEFSKSPWVLEVKVKTGAGCFYFQQDLNPGDKYLAQMGVYLRRGHEMGLTSRGLFLFPLIADRYFGEMWEILCRYEPETTEVVAYEARSILSGEVRALNHRYNMDQGLYRLADIQEQVKARVLPPMDKQYKYPLTPEMLASVSDNALKEMAAGNKVAGDWEIMYSRYREKHLALQGGRGYTPDELTKIFEEQARRKAAGPKKRAPRALKSVI